MRRGIPFRTPTYEVGRPPHLGRDRPDPRQSLLELATFSIGTLTRLPHSVHEPS